MADHARLPILSIASFLLTTGATFAQRPVAHFAQAAPYHARSARTADCGDTVYSALQTATYFCFGSCGIPFDCQITGSYSATATPDSTVAWICTYDRDGAGPLSAWPDSLAPGHDVRNSGNRIPLNAFFTPQYWVTNPQVTPFALRFPVSDYSTWADSGLSMAFTPVEFDSTAGNMLFFLSDCFGYGAPIMKTLVKSIRAQRYFTCDAGTTMLHIVPSGGFPQYKHYRGYGDDGTYDVNVNGTLYSVPWNDTLDIPASEEMIVHITDSLSTVPGLAEGCLSYDDTLRPWPALVLSGLADTYTTADAPVNFSVSPAPMAGLRIDFLASDPVSDGIYVQDAGGTPLYSLYPLGFDFGPLAIADVPTSIRVLDIPMSTLPDSITVTNDNGWGMQDATCGGLNNDGYVQVFDLSSGTPLSPQLSPVGDGQCGGSGNWVVDGYGGFTPAQLNTTTLAFDGPAGALSPLDASGHAVFDPAIAGPGTWHITFTYNDRHTGVCDKDTTYTVLVQSGMGVTQRTEQHPVLFPDPASDLITIRGLRSDVRSIEVLDMLGQVVLTERVAHDHPIAVSMLPYGAYAVRTLNTAGSPVDVLHFVKR